MNKIVCVDFIFAGLLIFSVPVNAAIYKWIDEDGNTHYSQSPPTNIETEVIAAPPQVDSESAKKVLEAQQKKFDELAENRRTKKEAEQQEQERIELAKSNCEKARAKLANNLNTGRIRAVDEDGNVVRAPEEERQRRIEDAREKVEKWCNQ